MNATTEIAVVGGGLVGTAIALRLAQAGREVMLIDPADARAAASYGNAGTIAPYGVVPVANPAVLQNLPALLFGTDSPLSIRWRAFPELLPWLLRFAGQCRPRAAEHNAVALAGLLGEASSAWRELATEANLGDLFRSNGCLYVFRHPYKDGWSSSLSRKLGVRQELLSAADVASLEPNLPAMAAGLFYPDASHIEDPGLLVARLHSAAMAQGVAQRQTRVDAIMHSGDGSIRLRCGGDTISAKSIVIAAGAWSKPLARQCGDVVPLETERGYHIEFACDTPPLSRPTSPIDLGFYMTPMQGRLRIAGTVELGGLSTPPTPRRLDYLLRGAKAMFPALGTPSSQWLGFRPSLPDSLPVIGVSPQHRNIFYAFGHGHLGLTLAAVTSRLVTSLVTGEAPEMDLSPFSPVRFR